jgi:hypothetical protein
MFLRNVVPSSNIKIVDQKVNDETWVGKSLLVQKRVAFYVVTVGQP